ncbi:MAG: tRNA pseudouridine(38-40) synthase TruA [Lachnospiraceae bacterium]|nr:tRNA pseudouridine(38-40) synthase TruA [Lachnospiraceae bacterium]
MRRIMLIVAYDGTNYCGWQVQPNGITIEGVLNRELSRILKEEIKVIGASRTDAGVHALGNTAVFDTSARIPADKVALALNQGLPDDIRIQHSMEVAPDFHPRHCESRKVYEYHVYNHSFDNPIGRQYHYFVHRPLEISAMQEAAAYFVGTHDFKSFCNIHTCVETTTRTIYECRVEKEQYKITIHIEGNGFLYNMVRIIAGTLIEVGNGLRKPAEIIDILAERNREAAGKTAPARGLQLVEIQYQSEWFQPQNGRKNTKNG